MPGLPTIQSALAAVPPKTLDDSPSEKRAAVAAILRPGTRSSSAEVLFMRRAEHPNDPWSGHMAFPGGRHELDDHDLLATAVRETHEEVGLDLRRYGEQIGQLDDLEAIANARRVGMVIRPYVFVVEPGVRLEPNYEVAELLWAPLAPMFEGSADTEVHYARNGHDLMLPGFDVQGRVVWGLTHRMLTSLFDKLGKLG